MGKTIIFISRNSCSQCSQYRGRVLDWSKRSSRLFIIAYRKIQMNFLATPILSLSCWFQTIITFCTLKTARYKHVIFFFPSQDFWKIWKYYWSPAMVVLLTSKGQRSRMLLNILHPRWLLIMMNYPALNVNRCIKLVYEKKKSKRKHERENKGRGGICMATRKQTARCRLKPYYIKNYIRCKWFNWVRS